MSEPSSEPPFHPVAGDVSLEPAHLLLIVVGAHLRAEHADRPLAQQLKVQIDDWLRRHRRTINFPLSPLVCTDVWYLNHEALQRRPTISIGGPGVNGLSAYYAKRIPTALVRDQQLMVQLDAEFVDLRVCLWGINHLLTVEALTLFRAKYMVPYLRAVATQVEPE